MRGWEWWWGLSKIKELSLEMFSLTVVAILDITVFPILKNQGVFDKKRKAKFAVSTCPWDYGVWDCGVWWVI